MAKLFVATDDRELSAQLQAMMRRRLDDHERSEGIEISLEAAVKQGLQWDVFVSHKSNDSAGAISIAKHIKNSGLSAWVDELDPNIRGDGPGLDSYIEDVLAHSFSLLALVTEVTHESWWVPFEIGLAFELRRFLSSYIEGEISLPSFLARHPRLRRSKELTDWCMRLKHLKASLQHQRVVTIGQYRVMGASRATYIRKMEEMARDFS